MYDTEQEGFVIDNDNKAEWALRKIAEEHAERDRLTMVIDNQIEFYSERRAEIEKRTEDKVHNLEIMLAQYFENVPHKSTKTQQTYELPSGKLVMKQNAPKIDRNDEVLTHWLMDNGLVSYIQTKQSPMWGELKSSGMIKECGDAFVLDETGEVVQGVQLIQQEPTFSIKIKEEK